MGQECPDVFQHLNRLAQRSTEESVRGTLLKITSPPSTFPSFVRGGLELAEAPVHIIERGTFAAEGWPSLQGLAIVGAAYLALTGDIRLLFVAGPPMGRPQTEIKISEEIVSITCSGSP